MRLKIYGPPGTGKTTTLAALTRTAVQNHGDRVLVASLTKAAAAEIAGRNLNLPRDNVGTLHHHCFRLLGNPPLVVKHLSEWNDEHPTYAISPENDLDRDDGDGGRPGDPVYAKYQLLRHRMRDRQLWDAETTAFANAWESWKQDQCLFDFTDLLEEALRDSGPPPGNPTAGIFDEVQDFSHLEFALVEKWAESMQSVCLAGDEDQALYEWRGADPQSMVEFPEDERRILGQSYRMPKAVHVLSQAWVKRIESRVDKPFLPRAEEGFVRRSDSSFAIDPALILEDASEWIARGRTVMLLASCEYMLRPVIAEARRLGIPFHNPFRKRAGHWNPLRPGKGVSASQRLLAYLRPSASAWGEDARMWTGADVALFSQPLRADLFGGRSSMVDLRGDEFVSESWMESHLRDESFLDLTPRSFEAQVLPSELRRFIYPLAIAERDPSLLREEPKLVVGTIHSVKGAEADIVYLSPELSPAQQEDWQWAPDSIVRQFYVGITRAKEGLVLLSESPRRYGLDELRMLA